MWSSFEPSSIAFSFGLLAVHWYGLIMAFSFVVGYSLIMNLNKQAKLDKKLIGDVVFYVIIFGLIGARIYDVLLDVPFFIKRPDQIIAVWNGGLAIHGGLIGGFLTVMWFVKKKGLDFWKFADIAVLAAILGQAIGRWGNFFNQELFGTPTNLPWKIFISPEYRPEIYASITHFHPTFLYESLLNFGLFFILYFLYKARKVSDGSVFLFYLIGYSIIRFFLEFIRIDPTPEFGIIRLPQIASVVLIALAVGVMFKRFER